MPTATVGTRRKEWRIKYGHSGIWKCIRQDAGSAAGNGLYMAVEFKNVIDELAEWTVPIQFFLALGEGLGVFDLLVIDLLWWRNTKRIRFSFLLEKAPYQDSAKHIGSFLRGIPLFAVVAVLSAGIVTLIG